MEDDRSRVDLNVSGMHLQISRDLMRKHPNTRLQDMCIEAEKLSNPLSFVVDRPTESFVAILAFYQTGELHMPANVCPAAFDKELIYWNINSEQLSNCCLVRYHAFFDEQDTLTSFSAHSLRQEASHNLHVPSVGVVSAWSLRRAKLWAILDNNEISIAAKIYFFVALAMVTLSIFATALNTVPSFQRRLTKCEIRDYVKNSDKFNYEETREFFKGLDCSDGFRGYQDSDEFNFHGPGGGGFPGEASLREDENFYFYYIYDPIPDYDSFDASGFPKPPSQIDSSSFEETPEPRVIKLPKSRTRKDVFLVIDRIVMSFFTVELFFRLLCCPSLILYFKSVINIIDLFALIGGYIHLIIENVATEERYETTYVDILEYVQMLRAFRLLRVVKNVTASKVLVFSVKQSARDLLVLVMFLIIAVVTYSNFLYFAESRKSIATIPAAWWWALVTITTVGYGDLVPQSTIGRIIGSFCAVTGVILLSITVPIFVNNFLSLYQYAVFQRKLKLKQEYVIAEKEQNSKSTAPTKAAAVHPETTVATDMYPPGKVKEMPPEVSLVAW